MANEDPAEKVFRILNETDAESVLEMPGGIVLRKEGALQMRAPLLSF